MKNLLQKAVVLLLFLLPAGLSAQMIQIVAVEDSSKQEIKEFVVTGFLKSKTTPLPALMDVATIESYDSILVQSFGYRNTWLVGVKIPRLKQPPPVLTMKVAMRPLFLEVLEVVVSAGKFVEPKKDVAQQIDIIKRGDIEFASQPTTADILQNNGTVLVQKSQLGGGSPIIRGFEANKVQIVIDGVRMNNAIYRGGHLQNVLRIDNNILDRVEILQGPGSVIYGSDALGGVMHFMTLTPQTKPLHDTTDMKLNGGAFFRYGTAAGETSGNFYANLGWNKVASLTSITYTQLGNLRQGSVGMDEARRAWNSSYYAARINDKDTFLANSNPLIQQNSGYAQFDIMQKILWKPSNKYSHLFNFQRSETNDVYRYDRLSLTDSAQNATIERNRFLNEHPLTNPLTNAEWHYGPEKRTLAAYTLTIRKSHQDSSGEVLKTVYKDYAKITAAFQDISESRHTRGFGSNRRTSRTERVQVASVNADFQEQKGKNEFRYGGEVYYNIVSSTAKSVNINTNIEGSAATRYPGDGSTMLLSAAYATWHRELGGGLIFNAGARLNYVSLSADFGDTLTTGFPFRTVTQNNVNINGKAGLVYNALSGWRFSALLSTGFRAPNVDDLGKVFDSSPADSIVIVPNPDLKHEYVYNGEVTIAKYLKGGVIEATGWYAVNQGAIVTRPYTLNGSSTILYDSVPSRVYANQNAQSAYLYGATLGFKKFIAKQFEIRGTVTYTYGRIETDSTPYPLDHIPPIYGRFGVRWWNDKITAEFFTLFNGAKKVKDYNMNGEDNYYNATIDGMPSWYTLNLRGAYRLSDVATMQLSIENILDQNYRVFASGISAPGRNIVATIRVNF